MHDAIPSRILNGWLRLEEDLFHLQVLSYLPPQLPTCLADEKQIFLPFVRCCMIVPIYYTSPAHLLNSSDKGHPTLKDLDQV